MPLSFHIVPSKEGSYWIQKLTVQSASSRRSWRTLAVFSDNILLSYYDMYIDFTFKELRDGDL